MNLWQKYKEPIAYIFFGVLTTLVNVVVYCFCAEVLQIYYLIANVLAWVGSVLFAFVTNKLWVFESKSWTVSVVLAEGAGFFLARVATGVVDMALMWLLVDVVALEDVHGLASWVPSHMFAVMEKLGMVDGELVAKIIVNIVVIVLNYVASKLWIFSRVDN